MSEENVGNRLKSILDDRSRGAWVFGVCLAIHEKIGCSLWCCRAGAIAALVFFTLPAIVIYVALGYYLDETRAETHKLFKAWGEILEKFGRLVWGKIRRWETDIQTGNGAHAAEK